ncbi:MAG: dihydroorotate dehydrogenase [Oscillospiraceae bacterium]|nr:dihydroorotate dehydrogenase [Oscillospiraceae bacterium]
MADLKINFAGIEFKNPIVTASGTFGFGREYAEFYDLSKLGGICVKGLTAKPREGNNPPRIAETPMGILNSVGLQNPGIDAFITDELPFLRKSNTVIIANISGNTIEEYAEMAEKLSNGNTDIIEVNVSCPNVKAGGIAFGTSPESVAAVTKAVREKTKTPAMIKLSPNVTDIGTVAKAAEDAGADAISLINTVLGMKIDIRTRKPILANNVGGLSGPAVLPIAVRMVWQVASNVKIPILGMGGVESGDDAIEMMLAGANLIGVGTACFHNPYAPIDIISQMDEFLDNNAISSAKELTGKVDLF